MQHFDNGLCSDICTPPTLPSFSILFVLLNWHFFGIECSNTPHSLGKLICSVGLLDTLQTILSWIVRIMGTCNQRMLFLQNIYRLKSPKERSENYFNISYHSVERSLQSLTISKRTPQLCKYNDLECCTCFVNHSSYIICLVHASQRVCSFVSDADIFSKCLFQNKPLGVYQYHHCP